MKISNVLSGVLAKKVVAGALTTVLVGGGALVYNNLNNELGSSQVKSLELAKQVEQTKSLLSEVRQQTDKLNSQLQTNQADNIKLMKQLDEAVANGTVKDSRIESLQKELAELKVEPRAQELSLADLYSEDGYSLGDNISLTIDDGDFSKLKDSQFKFDGENYDYHEEIVLSGPRICFNTHSDCVEEYKDQPVLQAKDSGWLEYKFVFDDSFDRSKVSDDEALEISFLGQNLRIVEADNSSVTVQPGKRVYLKPGDSNEGVKLLAVFDDAVQVQIGEDKKFIKEGKSEDVGGISVTLESSFTSEKKDDYAELFVGESGKQTFVDGDNFYLYGGDKSLPDYKAEWVWSISSTSLGVRYNLEKYDESALKLGQEVSLPTSFAKVKLDLKSKESETQLKLSFKDIKVSGNHTNALMLETSSSNGLKWNLDTGNVLAWDGSNFRAKDKDSDDYLIVSSVSLKDSGISLSGNGTNVSLGSLKLVVDLSEEKFSDVLVSSKSLDGIDQPSLTTEGFRLERIDDIEDLRSLKLVIPKKSPEFQVVVQ